MYIHNILAFFILCAACNMMLITPLKAEKNGWFIGANLGGALATNASFLKENGNNSGSIMLSTGVSIGTKFGYQAFFSKNGGMRFYLSAVTTTGVYPDTVNVSGSDTPVVMDLYILGDINADYLYNWSERQAFSAGFFIGFFSGSLVGIPIKNPNPTASNSLGITAGANLGIRTVINVKHQIEFGVKAGMALFFGTVTNQQGDSNIFTNIGAIMYGSAGYIYKF